MCAYLTLFEPVIVGQCILFIAVSGDLSAHLNNLLHAALCVYCLPLS